MRFSFFAISLLTMVSISCLDIRTSALQIYGGTLPGLSTPTLQSTVAVLPGDLTCSGALISQRRILTAAHCVAGVSISDVRVAFGEDLPNAERYQVVAIETYLAEMDQYFPNFDLAILEMDRDAPDTARPIPVGQLAKSTELLIAGYGARETEGDSHRSLLEARTSLQKNYDRAHAVHLFTTLGSLAERQGAPCFGDSGGPVYAYYEGQWHLVGITNGATLLHTPYAFIDKSTVDCKKGWGLHTALEDYRGWIESGDRELDEESHEAEPATWAEWVKYSNHKDPAWYTVERLLGILAQQPYVSKSDISRLFEDGDWSEQQAKSLTALNLKSTDTNKAKISDLRPLKSLIGLKNLSLNDVAISDFSPLQAILGLERLSIICSVNTPDFVQSKLDTILDKMALKLMFIGCKADEIFKLSWPNSVQELTLSNLSGPVLTQPYTFPQRLDALRINNVELPQGFVIPAVRQLSLENFPANSPAGITAESVNEDVTEIIVLRNVNCALFSSLLSFNFTRLRELELSNCQLEKLGNFNSMSNIRKLTLKQNPALRILPSLPSELEYLDTSSTAVLDLSALKDRPRLTIVAKGFAKGAISCPPNVLKCIF